MRLILISQALSARAMRLILISQALRSACDKADFNKSSSECACNRLILISQALSFHVSATYNSSLSMSSPSLSQFLGIYS